MTTCPNCGGKRVIRLVARVPGGQVGYNFCPACWARWDGVGNKPRLPMPLYVIAREEAVNA